MTEDPRAVLANRSRSLQRVNGLLKGSHEEYLQRLLRDRIGGRPPKVLDLGFGEGRALLELAWEFRGEDVDFFGIDGAQIPPVQRREDLATMMNVFEIGPASEVRLPEVSFRRIGTVGHEARVSGGPGRLPYDGSTFDLVYSAAVIRLIPDKALVLEEVCRVLCPGGVAILDVDDSTVSHPTGRVTEEALSATWCRFVILDGDSFVEPIQHLEQVAGSSYSVRLAHPSRLVLRIDKLADAPLDLRLGYDEDLSLSRARMPVRPDTGRSIGGTRSVYRVAH